MYREQFDGIYRHITEKLKAGLSPHLTYHNLRHTEDTLEQAVRIAMAEEAEGEEELFLLKTAVLYHDAGFIHTYKGHEEESCREALADLPSFAVSGSQLDRIRGLIMATAIPQSPGNKLEEIICDADLDYLGRDDFFSKGRTLFEEWKYYHIVENEEEWNRMQVQFLESHRYFTLTSRRLRNSGKLQHLAAVRGIVASYG